MHGAAITLARRMADNRAGTAPDVVLCSDMLDLAAFAGLARRRLRHTALVAYFHENQLGYPDQPIEAGWTESRSRRTANAARDFHYPFTNLTTCLAADEVWWNSRFNLESFLTRLPGMLGAMPDFHERGSPKRVADRSKVVRVGVDLASLDAEPGAAPRDAAMRKARRIVWNHRWEHDKAPDDFVAVIEEVAARGLEFELVLLGQEFGTGSSARDKLVKRLGGTVVVHAGHVSTRSEYARWLRSADIAVSTARQEFFGVAICEAAYCGCAVLVPDGLAYPELIPAAVHGACLYSGLPDLVDRLSGWLVQPIASRDPLREALASAMRDYDWSRMGTVYDRMLEAAAVRAEAA